MQYLSIFERTAIYSILYIMKANFELRLAEEKCDQRNRALNLVIVRGSQAYPEIVQQFLCAT